MTILPGGTAGRQPEEADIRGAGCRGDGARGLNRDEWDFLRATPDYDAEEMSSVTLPTPAAAPAENGGMPGISRQALVSPAEFPEAGTLVSMLGDLMQPEPGAAPAEPDAGPVWSGVPAADEWAELMGSGGGAGSQGAGGARAGAPVGGPPARDVLLDALAAGERAGLLPNRAPRER
jgi:hypothetical protein